MHTRKVPNSLPTHQTSDVCWRCNMALKFGKRMLRDRTVYLRHELQAVACAGVLLASLGLQCCHPVPCLVSVIAQLRVLLSSVCTGLCHRRVCRVVLRCMQGCVVVSSRLCTVCGCGCVAMCVGLRHGRGSQCLYSCVTGCVTLHAL